MKTLSGICLLLVFVSACRTLEDSLFSSYFNTGKLPEQSFTINPAFDTLLTSAGGVRIHIAKGSFEGDKPVTIEWKEALRFEDMLRAGLLTQSGKEILSSGGMFYLNTKEDVAIQKSIEIEVPTNTVVQGMQLYKGDSADGKIDWQEPKPIENIKAFGENVLGKKLFDGNCAQCHGIIDKEMSVPALAGVTERKSKPWLYAITRNPAAMMAIDPYLQCEKCKYGLMMQAFPNLLEPEMDSIYDYIEDETERLGLTGVIKNNSCDTCAIHDTKYDSLLRVYNDLYAENLLTSDSLLLERFSREAKSSQDYKFKEVLIDLAYRDSIFKVKMDEERNTSSKDIIQGKDYYQVSIQSDGWYNIDILLKESSGTINSKLIVKPQGERNQEMEYYLAIPALKILVEGGATATGDNVIFYEENGTIPLPQSRQAFVIAVGGTGENYFFSKTTFIISSEQTINLQIQKISKQQFDAQLTELSYYGLNSKVEKTVAYQDSNTVNFGNRKIVLKTNVNGDKKPVTDIEHQLLNLAAKKSKNCGCNGQPTATTARKDTTSALRPEQTTTPAKAPN